MPPIREPLALVGIGCRFPGNADSPTAFWELLRNGEDAITDVPVDRWSLRRFYHPNPDAPGKAYVRQGGFLRGAISSFEPAFFGITPREAAALDPQQRVLLEVTYEAFEDAGLSLDAVRGANIGVYIGAFTMDNLSQQLGVLSREAITTHTAVATTMTMLSNRLSYTFDLRGTSLSLDTACSSSLVAFHLACQAVWNGECEAALAGGVNIMFRPEFVIAMCKGHFLSPDARCKAFDAAANGYVRGEGAGVVLLKPLSQALADGDRIYALVRGTGSNQDGRTAGITLPNEAAQESLVQTVCAAAGIAGGQVAYVEAHGTGTAAGDPIEARSLSAALQAERTTPLWIGSVKTNIGHLEAAAGVAGVIKAALILYHKQIPPHLHFRTANPEIDLDALRLRIPLKVEPLPAVAGESYVGINSFGYGGTNAHAILSNAPPPTEAEDDPALSSSVYAVPLSARSSEALHQTAAAHAAHLTAYPRLPLADYAYTVSRRRTAHPLRAVAFASDRPSLLARLGEIAEGSGINGVGQTARRLVFVYTGMGPQWWGMGVELYRESPTFRAVIDECEALFRQIAPPDVSIHALFVAGDRQGAVMSDPIHAQPGNFALQAGLTALWREMGVIPAAIVGHSAGEIAAAYAAGTLTLYDALWVTYWRASLMQRTVGQGAMLAASIPPTEANAMLAAALNGEAQWVSIAALNSPTSVTLAGAPEALEKVAAHLTERGIFNAFLKVAVAYHSYQMSPLEGDFRAGLGDVHPAAPMIPLYSTVTGGRVGAGDHTTDYWWQNAQQPVQLAPAIQAISGEGGDAFLEIGPHPVLGTAILETLRAEGREGITFPSLRRGKPERETLHVALGGLWAGGVAVDWACWSPSGRIVSLPTYAWQRDTLWAETPRASADRLTPDEHPLLQRRLPTPEPTWEGDLGAYFLDYLRDHRVQGTPIFPAAGYVEALLAAAGTLPVTLERLRFSQALSLESAASICLTERAGAVTISSRTVDDHWTTHATGTILTKALPIGDGQRPHLSGAALESIYPALAERGLPYGESFRPIRALWRAEQKVTAALALPDGLAEDYERYHLHPVLLDGALQTFFAFLDEAAEGLFIPTGIQRVRLHRQAPRGRVWSVARLTRRAVRFVEGDVRLYDEAGGVIAELEGVRLTRLAGWKHETPEVLYHLAWVAQAPIQGHPAAISAIHETNDSHPPSVTLIFADSVGMARVIGGAGTHDAVYVLRGQTFRADAAGVTLNPNDPEGWAALFAAHPPTRFERILYAWGIDLNTLAEDDPCRVGSTECVGLLHLIQALHGADPDSRMKRLVILTAGACAVDEEDDLPAPGAAALWGMGRVIANEHSALRAQMIDLPSAALTDPLAMLHAAELAAQVINDPASEPEIALRGGIIFHHRLAPYHPSAHVPRPPLPEENYALRVGTPGIIDSLFFEAVPRRAPKTGEIEVIIASAGLNFKDVMKVMNVLSDDYLEGTFFTDTLGLESAGEVIAVGDGVTDIRVGDRVIVFPPGGGMQRYVTLPAAHAVPRPATLPLAQAPTLTNFVTAYYALVTVGGLQAGETVLIHAAAGGVGLAAIQVAQSIGAVIYATAGNKEKRDYLNRLGISYVSDSRSLRFVDDVRRWTDGRGVDVILNSLWGEMLSQSVDLLAPYGRFVEIGKRDISANANLAMGVFNRGATFSAIDLDTMMVDHPQRFQQALRIVCALFEAGTLTPLPATHYPATAVHEAFRQMAAAQHIGKLFVTFDDPAVLITPQPQPIVQAEGTYLVTGGVGGFGLAVGRWLAEQGAGTIVLVGRRGAASEELGETLSALQAQGVTVRVEACDVSDAAAVKALIAMIQGELPPLRGVYHAAMVLDDEVLIHLNRARFESVTAPKAVGAWNLYEALRAAQVTPDHIVFFSSVSAFIGNPRQANYVAANAFLDGFAAYLRRRGLNALSVNWGSIGKVGVVARNPKIEQYLSSVGVMPLDPVAAAEGMAAMLRDPHCPPQVAIVAMDWARWASNPLNVTDAPLYVDLVRRYESGSGDGELPFVAALRSAPEGERVTLATDFLREKIAAVTRLPLARLDGGGRLDQLGIDSLMGVELNNVIRHESGVEFSVMTLMQGLTIRQLGEKLAQNAL